MDRKIGRKNKNDIQSWRNGIISEIWINVVFPILNDCISYFNISLSYIPLEAYRRLQADSINLSIKKNIAWEGVANPPYVKTAKNLPMTYKKHYYNGGLFRFVKSLDTNTQITILLLQYEDYFQSIFCYFLICNQFICKST